MKKMLLVALTFAFFSSPSFAHDHANKSHVNKDEKQSSTKKEKKSRRKKVEMCGECSKPETQCECPGHGDNPAKKHD